jgi:hypothetical protein
VGPRHGRAQHQPLGDLTVAEPLADQRQHLPLPLGEHGRAVLRGLVSGPGGGELGDQPAGDPGRQQRLAGRDHPNGMQQLGRPAVLEQEAAGAGLQGLEDVGVGVVSGQDQDSDPLQAAHGRDLTGG